MLHWLIIVFAQTAPLAAPPPVKVIDPYQSYTATQQLFIEETQNYRNSIKQKKLNEYNRYFENQERRNNDLLLETKNGLELNLIRFIKEHPEHTYTPYALYQLGSFYFELGMQEPSYFASAEQYYAELLKRFPKFDYLQETTYLLAYSRLEQNKEKEAIATFNQLVRDFPKSRLLDEAYLRIGEYFFHKNDFKTALTYYDRVHVGTESPLYYKTLYKSAWSNYLIHRYDLALKGFLSIFRQGKESEFHDEAKQYVAVCIAQMRTDQSPLALLGGLSHDEIYEIGMLYGTYLTDNGMYGKAGLFYNDLSNVDTKHPQSPVAYYLAIKAFQQMGRNDEAKQMRLTYLDRYPAIGETRKLVLFDSASYYYQGYVDKRLGSSALPTAQGYFSEIMQQYPESRESYDAQFYYAEAAYSLGNYEVSAHYYQQVLLNSSFNQHFEASLISIVATQEKRLTAAKSPLEKKLIATQLVQALDDLVQRSRGSMDKEQYAFKSAQILFALDRTDEALERLQTLISANPDKPIAESAAREAVAMLAKKQRWPELLDWVGNLQKQTALQKKVDVANFLNDASINAYLQLAKANEEKQRYLVAGNLYVKMASLIDAKTGERRKALSYAGQLFLKAQSYDLAIATLQSAQNEAATLQTATDLAAIQNSQLAWQEAVATLKPYAAANNPQALQYSAQLTLLLGNQLSAADLYKRAAEHDNEWKSRASAMQEAARLYEENGKYNEALACFLSLLKERQEADHYVGAIRNHLNLNQPKQAQTLINKSLAQKSIQKSAALADLLLLTGNVWSQRFMSEPTYQNNNVNNKKIQALDQAETYYLRLLQTNQSRLLGKALLSLATMYDRLADDLLEHGDHELAKKLADKALQIHQKNLTEAHKRHGFNNETQQSLAILQKRLPQKYLKTLDDYQWLSGDQLFLPPYINANSAPLSGSVVYDGRSMPAEAVVDLANSSIRKDQQSAVLVRQLETLSLLPSTSPDLLFNLARTHALQDNWPAAATSLGRIGKQNGVQNQPAEYWLLQGDVAMMSGDKDGALREFSRHQAIFGDSYEVKLNIAATLTKNGKTVESQKVLRQLLAVGNESPRLYYLLSENARLLYGQAAQEYLLRRGLNRFNLHPQLTSALSIVLATQGRYGEAYDLLSSALATHKKPYLLNNLGILNYVMGNYSVAEQLVANANALGNDLASLYNLAAIQFAGGKSQLAGETYKRYLYRGGKARQLGEVFKS